MKLTQQEIATLVSEVRETYKDITLDNILNVVVSLMRTLAKYTTLTGAEKKASIVEILNFIVDEDHHHDELDGIIKLMIPTAIDTLIDAEKGKLKLRKKLLCCCL